MREPEYFVGIGIGTIGMAVGVSIVLWWVGYLAARQVVDWVAG